MFGAVRACLDIGPGPPPLSRRARAECRRHSVAAAEEGGTTMPIAGIGLHIILALFCAVHAVRSGQPTYWLFILFSFPLLGSVVYFFAIYLPHSRLERGARRAVSAAVRALDPGRDVREARAEFDETPTAQNQMRLAAALLEAGEAPEAAQLYESCLKGPFASDAEMRLGAARAFVECQRYAEAQRHLEAVRAERADFRPDTVSLLLARSHAGQQQAAAARAEFESALARFGTFESRAEYAIWALGIGDAATADRMQAEIDKITARWNPHNRELNEPVMRRLRAARELARQPR